MNVKKFTKDIQNQNVWLIQHTCVAEAGVIRGFARTTNTTAVMKIEGECTQFNLQMLLLQQTLCVHCSLNLRRKYEPCQQLENIATTSSSASASELILNRVSGQIPNDTSVTLLHYGRRFTIGIIAVKQRASGYTPCFKKKHPLILLAIS